MFEPAQVFLAICMYMGLLFAVALYAERRARAGRNLGNHPLVYSLSLAVYCTAWTYYGSVGKAVSTGMLFLAIYLGPTLGMLFWWFILRRLVRIKEMHHVTSLADLVSLRYGKSQGVAALATLVILVGITPYIALQLKAVVSTFNVLTTLEPTTEFYGGLVRTSSGELGVGPLVAGLMIVFTIAFGARRLDPTERHQGMIIAVVLECLVKVVAFLAVGVFVTYFLNHGFADIFAKIAARPYLQRLAITGDGTAGSYLIWTSYMILAVGAVVLLPRQFHVAVVENFAERHISTAVWVFPLYMLLINLFVAPIALGGMLLGYPAGEADAFVLRLPLDLGYSWLALLVFLGGFSAATAMVMIESMTLATMISNHLFLPLLERIGPLAFLRRRLLFVRWLAIVLVIAGGYWFKLKVGESYLLVDMGIISFAAMMQFAPAVLGGLFWRGANKAGALLGLGAGFALWVHAMLLPAFVKNGWLPGSILDPGPWGMTFLSPENLFGITALDPLTNFVFLSLLINSGLFVAGSLLFPSQPSERRLAEDLVGVMGPPQRAAEPPEGEAVIMAEEKLKALSGVLAHYLPPAEAQALLSQCLHGLALEGRGCLSVVQLADLTGRVETALAGSIGAAAAYAALARAGVFTPEESEALSLAYADMLAAMRVSPLELRRRLDYYQAREQLLKRENELLLRSRQLFQEKLTALDRLARSVAHEIRNPVTTIGGLAQRMISQAGVEGRETKYLDKILSGVQSLEKIVREVRAYADLPAPHALNQDLGLFLGEIAEYYRQRCDKNEVRLTLEGAAGLGGQISAQLDPLLVERALKVLIDNALDAMPQGGELRLGLSSDGETASISVSDTGPGIPAEDLPYIFDPFFSTKTEAVGMSLAIARRIAADHQGDLTAVSHLGKGATFTLTLPLRSAPWPEDAADRERPPALR